MKHHTFFVLTLFAVVALLVSSCEKATEPPPSSSQSQAAVPSPLAKGSTVSYSFQNQTGEQVQDLYLKFNAPVVIDSLSGDVDLSDGGTGGDNWTQVVTSFPDYIQPGSYVHLTVTGDTRNLKLQRWNWGASGIGFIGGLNHNCNRRDGCVAE
jgi:hypothetical protein